VLGGTVSYLDAVVFASEEQGLGCGSVAVGVRHALTVSFCVGQSALQIAGGPILGEPEFVVGVSEVLTGPVVTTSPSEVRAVLLVTDEYMPVTPAALAASDPAVDDTLTAIGYGNPSGVDVRRAGAIRVNAVDGALFTAAGVGDVEFCRGDGGAFDGNDALAGYPLYGEPGTGNCMDPMTFAAVSTFRTFVQDNVTTVDPPDAGPDAPDAGPGAPDAGEDGDDDGGCRVGGSGQSTGTAWLLLVALWLTTRARLTVAQTRQRS
jgi:hypothetical protein